MKVSSIKTQNLSDLKILFRPKNITFHHPKGTLFKIYLEKNVQIMGQINEIINISPRMLTYVFANDLQPISFRTMHDKLSNYQISLYVINTDGSQSFVDNAFFSLQKFLKDYFQEFLKLEEQLATQMIGKSQSMLGQLWPVISSNFTKKQYTSLVKFKNADVLFEFSCTPYSYYDSFKNGRKNIDQDMISQIKNPQNGFVKSKTLPQNLYTLKPTLDTFVHIESEIIHSDEKNKGKGRKITSIQQFNKSKIKLQNIYKATSAQRQIAINQKLKDGNTASFSKRRKNSLIMIDSASQDNLDPTERPLPQIYISNLRDIRIPETKNSIVNSAKPQGKKKNVSLKSQQNESNIKNYIANFCWIVFYSTIIIYLMHPISK